MKLNKFLIIAILSGGIAFTSCRNNDRGLDDDVEVMESETTDAQMRTTMGADDDVSTRIRENRNLTTFSENMERNRVTQNWDQNRTGTTTGQGTTTGTTGQGTTTGTTNQGTTTGQNQTTTGQNQTTTGQNQTTTGQNQTTTGQNQTTTGQGQMAGQTSVTYTIFAPSNDAYENLSETQRNEMMDEQNRERNAASINYLMVEQRLTEEELRNQIQNANGTHTIRTMQGENITAVLEGDDIVLRDASGNEARIIETDAGASGGVVHVIDRVLMPRDPGQNAAANRSTNNNTGTNNNRNTNTGNSR